MIGMITVGRALRPIWHIPRKHNLRSCSEDMELSASGEQDMSKHYLNHHVLTGTRGSFALVTTCSAQAKLRLQSHRYTRSQVGLANRLIL